jgi:hypothetical protein
MYAKLTPLQTSLPTSGQLSDRTWVSNYHLLPDAVLKAEGWLEAEEVWTPCSENQVPAFDKAEVIDGKILIRYKAMDVPPDPLQVVKAELDSLKAAVAVVTKINLVTAVKADLVAAINGLKMEPVKTEPLK